MQLVVPSAVRNAVSAATITFTASSMIRCFFILGFFLPRKNTDEHGVFYKKSISVKIRVIPLPLN